MKSEKIWLRTTVVYFEFFPTRGHLSVGATGVFNNFMFERTSEHTLTVQYNNTSKCTHVWKSCVFINCNLIVVYVFGRNLRACLFSRKPAMILSSRLNEKRHPIERSTHKVNVPRGSLRNNIYIYISFLRTRVDIYIYMLRSKCSNRALYRMIETRWAIL